MKDLQGSLIFAICLLAFTAVVFFFKYGQERAQSQVLEVESAAAKNRALTMEKEISRRAEEAERMGRIAQQSAVANYEKAKQAREMLAKAKSSTELSQKEIVDKLNAQLEREADARISAEKASVELAKQRDVLKKTVAETRQALEKLRAQKTNQDTAKISGMQKLLKEREDEIEALKKRQAELERIMRESRASQLATEREIENRGGLVLLPRHKRILSPNIRQQ